MANEQPSGYGYDPAYDRWFQLTAREIAARVLLDDGRDLTPERMQKLKGLCARMKVPFSDVLELLPAGYVSASLMRTEWRESGGLDGKEKG